MQYLTSIAITQSRRMHWEMASDEPLIVTALSVEPGSISLATWIDAPVDCHNNTNKTSSKLQEIEEKFLPSVGRNM